MSGLAVAASEVEDNVSPPESGKASHKPEAVFEQPPRVAVLLGKSGRGTAVQMQRLRLGLVATWTVSLSRRQAASIAAARSNPPKRFRFTLDQPCLLLTCNLRNLQKLLVFSLSGTLERLYAHPRLLPPPRSVIPQPGRTAKPFSQKATTGRISSLACKKLGACAD